MRGLPSLLPRSVSRVRAACAAAFAVMALASFAACGTSPVGVDSCRKIQKVRCESAPACGIDLTRPLHSGDSAESAVAACTRYYDDECLHGLALTQDPTPSAVDACVQAIITGDCSVVKAPETNLACAFLVPPDASADDASDTTDTTDADDSGG